MLLILDNNYMPISFMFIKVNNHMGMSCILIVMPYDGSFLFHRPLAILIQGPQFAVMQHCRILYKR